MSDQLERIKELHNKANELFSDNYKTDDFEKVKETLMTLFNCGYTDWLIEQTEKFEKLEKAYFDEDYYSSRFIDICGRVFEGR